jgi:PPE-repeat protein
MQDKVGDGIVFDFGSVPPEIISEQIYMGPGGGSLMTAAAAWQQVASELESSAAAYNAVLQQLTDVWQGPSAAAMVTAGMPYVWWLQDIALRTAETGIQVRAAAAAFQVAHATVVPPPAIAANRTEWTALVATNLFGHNTPAIAANEAHYAEMWAQDVAAMSQYSASSRAATSAIRPFTSAPVTSRSAATATAPVTVTSTGATKAAVADAAASAVTGDGLLSTQTLPDLAIPYVQSLVSSGAPINLLTMLATFTGYNALAEATRGNKPPMVPGLGGPGGPGGSVPSPKPHATAPVSASAGSAPRMGNLSVPPNWAQPQNIPPAASPLSNTPQGGKQRIPIGLPTIPAVPVITAGARKRRKKGSDPDDFDYGKPMPPLITRHPSGG